MIDEANRYLSRYFDWSRQLIFVSLFIILLLLSSCNGAGDISISQDAGSQTTTAYYYFAVTAIDQNDQESGNSNEVSVEQSSALQKTLAWFPPDTHIDGTPLAASDIKMYRLHIGTSSNVYLVSLSVGTTTSVALSSLADQLPK